MTNFVKEDFKFGDIIASRSGSFLSKGIRWFLKKLNPGIQQTFSHIAVVISVWDEVWVAEALSWGVRIWAIEKSDYLTHSQVIILRDKRGFTPDQVKTLSKECTGLGGTRYQYENLPQWILKILFKIKIFKTDNENAIYCSELGAISENSVYPGTYPTPNMTSPNDHFLNPMNNIIDKNNIVYKIMNLKFF